MFQGYILNFLYLYSFIRLAENKKVIALYFVGNSLDLNSAKLEHREK